MDSSIAWNKARYVEKQQTTSPDGRVEEIWPLPLEEALLTTFFTDVFENYHDRVVFGPLIPGAAYELKAPARPVSVRLNNGYLTVHWGTRGHFHLCVGEARGTADNPNSPEVIAHRRPARAEFYRRLDRAGLPLSWGFRMFNGHNEPQITLIFPNPYVTDEDEVTTTPDWARLTMWKELLPRYTGNEPDGLDEQGRGFRSS